MPESTSMDRRRALLLAAAVMAAFSRELSGDNSVEAARRKSRKKSGKKKKSGKHKKSQGSGKSGSSSGDEIVRVAKKYKGSKYVWAGASPKGFDCSGFTWYVYNQVTGKDIGRSVKGQYKQGNSVGRGSWKPGDIVFFKNTFEKGLSHCGIFISADKFIHAENESTGVVISSLGSGYYKDHYAGARRLV